MVKVKKTKGGDMKRKKIIKGFNGWMDAYIKDPKEFMETQASIHKHLLETAKGEPLSYGERCESTLAHYGA